MFRDAFYHFRLFLCPIWHKNGFRKSFVNIVLKGLSNCLLCLKVDQVKTTMQTEKNYRWTGLLILGKNKDLPTNEHLWGIYTGLKLWIISISLYQCEYIFFNKTQSFTLVGWLLVCSWLLSPKIITQKPFYLQYCLVNSLSVFLDNSYLKLTHLH